MKEMTIDEVHSVLLEMLKHIHQFCMENGINYSLSGGTLLGAIRHNGFIPWDNDADIQMLRPDYEKFVRLYPREGNYSFYSADMNRGYKVFTNVGLLYDETSTYLDQGPAPRINKDVGIWIDIIPVDGAPSELVEAQSFIRKRQLGYLIIRCMQARLAPWSVSLRYRSMKKRLGFLAGKMIGYLIPYSYISFYIKFCQKYNIEDSDYFVASDHYGIKEWQPKSIMSQFVNHKFEDTELSIMADYDSNLKYLYGDYMKLPSEGKRNNHSNVKFYWK